MLEVIPFFDRQFVLVVHWGSTGRWLVIEQVAQLVFGWSEERLRYKLLYDSMSESRACKIVRVSEKQFLRRLVKLGAVGDSREWTHLVHLQSMSAFLKNFAKRSRFTLFYDILTQLQWKSNPLKKRTLSPMSKKYVASLQTWKCAHCQEPLPSRFEVDHLIPWSEGGTDDLDNLQALCPNCHAHKTELDRQVIKHENWFSTPDKISKMTSPTYRVSPSFCHKPAPPPLISPLRSQSTALNPVGSENGDTACRSPRQALSPVSANAHRSIPISHSKTLPFYALSGSESKFNNSDPFVMMTPIRNPISGTCSTRPYGDSSAVTPATSKKSCYFPLNSWSDQKSNYVDDLQKKQSLSRQSKKSYSAY
ncbi:uncharacterized protein LOC126322603 [Schistocerca gregaria]|uniref:uncharacterized protein LOC126322603 n=1 Tax=Schistocerca gregaria TaxID=7010 RepID=UPI00211E08F7|nr:uncharacterized protein LOC126322603 [Schistocerca gregaria]